MSPDVPTRGPGIRCPPPVYFLGAGLAAWALDRWLPLPLVGDARGPALMRAGWGLLAAGGAMLAWGLVTLIRFRTTFHPDRDATCLVTAGPYRYSRNPIYVGMTAAYAGVALFANSAWALALLPLVLVLVATRVVGREERYLARAFGDEYSAYRRRVRRWL